MSDQCTGLFGRLFGHDYHARYSMSGAKTLNFTGVCFPSDLERLINASKSKTYHGDVCRRCGVTANNGESKT